MIYILNNINGLLVETWSLFIEMAPYLIFGFFLAGILNVFIPRNKIYQHLSNNNIKSVIKASIFGIPLPLCSCSVIPVSAHLKKEGAGKGPVVSFLVSSPTSGVDSILATYSLMGPLFAIIRPIASLFNGLIAGILTNIFDNDKISDDKKNSNTINKTNSNSDFNIKDKILKIFNYGFIELIEDIWKWLAIGILIGGIISYFIPAHLFDDYLSNAIIAYPIMFLIAIPMYVCATGSIPIAASLLMKGLTPGAALVFLIAGPATNTATLSFIWGKFGKKTLLIYLSTIILTSVLFGVIIDFIWIYFNRDLSLIHGHDEMIPYFIKVISGIVLLSFIIKAIISKIIHKIKDKNIKEIKPMFIVNDMTCEHCKASVTKAISKISGVKNIIVNLQTKEVEVNGEYSDSDIISTLEKAGYHAEKI